MNGNYRLKNVSQMGGEETVAYEADIVLDNRVVGHASNTGRGGASTFHFRDHAARDAFVAAATGLFPEAIEPDEDLINRLLAMRSLNLKRGWIFITVTEAEFWSGDGAYSIYPISKTPWPKALRLLREREDSAEVLVWEPEVWRFVPLSAYDLEGDLIRD